MWWEYPAANGEIIRGCGLSQKILLPLFGASIQSAISAAASADKAANTAATATDSAMSGMSLILGLATGQIRPPELDREERLAIETKKEDLH